LCEVWTTDDKLILGFRLGGSFDKMTKDDFKVQVVEQCEGYTNDLRYETYHPSYPNGKKTNRIWSKTKLSSDDSDGEIL